jgi:hypothetical protein
MIENTATTFLLREPLRLELNARGYPITRTTFNKLCLPAIGGGPPVAKWFGKRPLYRLDEALAWAESRCSSTPGKLVA